MRALLAIAATTIAVAATPRHQPLLKAAASRSAGIPSTSANSGFGNGNFRHDRRRNRGFDGAILYYDREYQGDTAWRSDSFNDWWHERPNRSYPAWMFRNQDCQRKWWDGSVLRC